MLHKINFILSCLVKNQKVSSSSWNISIHMMMHDVGSDDFMSHYKTEFEGFKQLSEFYTKFSTLPMYEEKALISLYRWFLSFDSYYEAFNELEIRKTKINESKWILKVWRTCRSYLSRQLRN